MVQHTSYRMTNNKRSVRAMEWEQTPYGHTKQYCRRHRRRLRRERKTRKKKLLSNHHVTSVRRIAVALKNKYVWAREREHFFLDICITKQSKTDLLTLTTNWNAPSVRPGCARCELWMRCLSMSWTIFDWAFVCLVFWCFGFVFELHLEIKFLSPRLAHIHSKVDATSATQWKRRK